jgi:S-adenosylmethionine synthetase
VDAKPRLNYSDVPAVIAVIEIATAGEPGKFPDLIAEAILGATLEQGLLPVSGMVSAKPGLNEEVARQVRAPLVGYGLGKKFTVMSHVNGQSADIAFDEHPHTSGARSGDTSHQDEISGHPTEETPDVLSQAYVPGSSLCRLEDPEKTSWLAMFLGLAIRNTFCGSFFFGVTISW